MNLHLSKKHRLARFSGDKGAIDPFYFFLVFSAVFHGRTAFAFDREKGSHFVLLLSGSCSSHGLDALEFLGRQEAIKASLSLVTAGVIGEENLTETYGPCLKVHFPGDLFGTSALITTNPQRSTIIARESCEYLVVSREDYRRALCIPDDGFEVITLEMAKIFKRQQEKIASSLAMGHVQELKKSSLLHAPEDLLVLDRGLSSLTFFRQLSSKQRKEAAQKLTFHVHNKFDVLYSQRPVDHGNPELSARIVKRRSSINATGLTLATGNTARHQQRRGSVGSDMIGDEAMSTHENHLYVVLGGSVDVRRRHMLQSSEPGYAVSQSSEPETGDTFLTATDAEDFKPENSATASLDDLYGPVTQTLKAGHVFGPFDVGRGMVLTTFVVSTEKAEILAMKKKLYDKFTVSEFKRRSISTAKPELVQTLSKIAAFNQLNPQELLKLTERMNIQTVHKNGFLQLQGDAVDSVIIIKSGKVRLSCTLSLVPGPRTRPGFYPQILGESSQHVATSYVVDDKSSKKKKKTVKCVLAEVGPSEVVCSMTEWQPRTLVGKVKARQYTVTALEPLQVVVIPCEALLSVPAVVEHLCADEKLRQKRFRKRLRVHIRSIFVRSLSPSIKALARRIEKVAVDSNLTRVSSRRSSSQSNSQPQEVGDFASKTQSVNQEIEEKFSSWGQLETGDFAFICVVLFC